MYWLELLNETNYITDEEFNTIYPKCNEVLKIIKSIIITTKRNNS
ncbi:MAG: four helix bundle protein [Flavobacterium sp.]